MHKQVWGFSLFLSYIMDSNRREYNLVCKQQAIPENIHATFTQSTSSSHALSRWSAPFVPESWLWYGVVVINNLDKTCHNLLRGSPEALKSISIPFILTNWCVFELTWRKIKQYKTIDGRRIECCMKRMFWMQTSWWISPGDTIYLNQIC